MKTLGSTKSENKSKVPSLAMQLLEQSKKLAATALKSKGLTAVTLLLISILVYHVSHGFHASEAVLYLFANNGKVSGRMGGDVKMRNGRSRGFTVPALVRNTFTSRVRALFASLSSAFRTLTQDQQAGWNGAAGFSLTDRFAQVHVLKGKQLFVSLNSNLTNVGQPIILDAPVATGVLPVPDQTFAVGPTGGDHMNLGSSLAAVAAGTAVLVFMTPMLSAGISRPSNSLFRLITPLPAGGTFPFNLIADYALKFGGLVLGAKVFIRTVTINIATGEASAITQSEAIVAV